MNPPSAAALRWAAEVAGSRVVAVRELLVTLANHALHFADGPRLVLRRWARPGWDDDDPDLNADRERGVLMMLEGSAVPAPRLVAADVDAEFCDVPALLVTLLDGAPPGPAEVASPRFVAELLRPLPLIHAVQGRPPDYEPYRELERLTVPAWSLQPALWRRVLDLLDSAPPDLPSCFLHRDYHPGNTLWAEGRLVGVVDWTTGSWGPAAVDLGHLRVNLALHHDLEMDGGHPWWDLRTLADLLADLNPDPAERERLERYAGDRCYGLENL